MLKLLKTISTINLIARAMSADDIDIERLFFFSPNFVSSSLTLKRCDTSLSRVIWRGGGEINTERGNCREQIYFLNKYYSCRLCSSQGNPLRRCCYSIHFFLADKMNVRGAMFCRLPQCYTGRERSEELGKQAGG